MSSFTVKKCLFVIALVSMSSFTHGTSANTSNSMKRDFTVGGCSCGEFIYDTFCFTISSMSCIKAPSGNPTITYGVPGWPLYIDSCVCDACDTVTDQEIDCSYSKETGFSFCLTVAASVGFTPPIGGNWTISASGQWCWSNTTTRTVAAKVSCNAGTKAIGTVWETTTPITVTTPTSYTLQINHQSRGWDCPPSFVTMLPCWGPDVVSAGTIKQTILDVDDVPCPEGPPKGGGIPCPTCPAEA